MGRKTAMKNEPRKELWWDKHSKKYRLYPHLIAFNIGDGKYKCNYCGLEGNYNDVFRKIGCTERTKPCKWCGESPSCAPDCTGIRMIFSDPKVYIAGDNPFEVEKLQ